MKDFDSEEEKETQTYLHNLQGDDDFARLPRRRKSQGSVSATQSSNDQSKKKRNQINSKKV